MSEEQEESKTQAIEVNLDSLMAARLPTGPAALKNQQIFERDMFTFPMSGDTCMPGVFYDENDNPQTFKLTVVGLLHQEEIEATRTVKAPTDLPFALAKRCLYKFNDKIVDEKKRNFLWEAIGPKGRQVMIIAYGQVNAAGDEALGKLQTDWEV